MNNIKITIHRYELVGNPPSRMVGFLITSTTTNKHQYVETLVGIDDYKNKTEEEICVFAYNQLKSRIDSIIESFNKVSFIIGSEFVP